MAHTSLLDNGEVRGPSESRSGESLKIAQIVPHPLRQWPLRREVLDGDPSVVPDLPQCGEQLTQIDDAFVKRGPLRLPGETAVPAPSALPPCAVLGVDVRQVRPQRLQAKPVRLMPLPDHVTGIVDHAD